MGRTKWLDGLRGVAAAIVAFDHLFMSDVWHPFISFWSEPADANRHIVQLPFIRILFSAQAMVTLFMVISGYAISISLLRDQNSPQFMDRMSSAIIRRVFRIYLPVLITACLAQFLYFFDLFHWTFEKEFLERLPRPWTNPFGHIAYVFGFMAEVVNIVTFRYPGSLNGQLWTMPIEFRGSNVVYLLIVGVSAWRIKSRLYVLPFIGAYFLWCGNWDIFGFIWGLWLAQRASSSTSSEAAHSQYEMAELEDSPSSLSESQGLGSCFGKDQYSSLNFGNITRSRVAVALNILLFITGFYLLCLGLDGHLPPGYQFLEFLQPQRWTDSWDICHMCWKAIGSAMLVYSIGELPPLQRPLNTPVVQYLGKISFALYLLHETVYQLWRNPLRDFIFLMLSGKVYGGSDDALNNLRTDPFAFHVAWWTTGGLLGAVIVCTAHYYTIHIDNRCVALAKMIDRWLSS